MVADNDEIIIKRKASYIVDVRDDIHTAKPDFVGVFMECSLHDDGVVPNGISCIGSVSFRLLCAKGAYPNGIIEVNKVFNV